ncbi:protein disulfide-isomerase precursor [Coelomomyces lativittatus]|nr:protein disulfide-isomerase precursor [Coelomomyces lativittatus]KAJ1508014.1 protein disulfide-isomerase precursor [Coelomomyces lativittatus]KAJ1513714.1 protein disulfide-isomerase precursor [Coelomomyces lativittatus]
MQLYSVSCFFFWLLLSISQSLFVNSAFSEKDLVLDVGVVHSIQNKEHFDALTETDQIILFKFYATWCGHCKQLAPVLDKVAERLKKNKISAKIVKIDCEQHAELASAHKIRGYPTLKVLRNKKLSDYEGGSRTEDDLYEFLVKETQDDWFNVHENNATDFKKSADVVLLGHFKDSNSAEAKAFQSLASTYRKKHRFGIVNDPKLLGVDKVSDHEVLVYRQSDNAVERHQGGFTVEELEKFLHAKAVPLVGEINEKTFEHYVSSQLPLVFFFYNDPKQKETYKSVMETLAKKYEQKYNFGFCDASKFGGYGEELTLKPEWPAIAIQHMGTREKWAMDQSPGSMTDAKITQFVNQVAEGVLSPSIRSQTLTETKKDHLYQTTAKSFDEDVINNDQDVLVEFYAPWCQHCKRLEPILQSLGKAVNNKHVKVVQFDGSQNDVPRSAHAEVQGFPTLKLYRANNKKEPLGYEGERTEQAMLTFLQANAHHKDVLADIKISSESTDDHAEL